MRPVFSEKGRTSFPQCVGSSSEGERGKGHAWEGKMHRQRVWVLPGDAGRTHTQSIPEQVGSAATPARNSKGSHVTEK